jgi:hypothetical protein
MNGAHRQYFLPSGGEIGDKTSSRKGKSLPKEDLTLGRTDVVDPSYGTVYSVPNDYDQYWRTNSGTFIGGSWGTQPDPSWHKLEPIKL